MGSEEKGRAKTKPLTLYLFQKKKKSNVIV